MITLRKATFTLTWDGQRWSGDRTAVVAALNAVRDEAAGYLPDEVNVRRMLKRSLGSDECQILRNDQPASVEGRIY